MRFFVGGSVWLPLMQHQYAYFCAECGMIVHALNLEKLKRDYKYCSRCGRKMDIIKNADIVREGWRD